MFFEYSKLWHLPIKFDKIKIMILGTQQDQPFDFSLGGHKKTSYTLIVFQPIFQIVPKRSTCIRYHWYN